MGLDDINGMVSLYISNVERYRAKLTNESMLIGATAKSKISFLEEYKVDFSIQSVVLEF